MLQSSPWSRPLRARAPTGSDAFAAAPYCGGSYLTPAKWQMCGGSCSQKPRTRVRTGGAVSPRLRRGPPPGLRFPQTRRPSVPFKRQELAYGSKPPSAVGTGGPQGSCQSPPSVRAQNCFERPGSTPRLRYAAFGLPIDSTGTAPRIECHLCFHAQLLIDPILSRMNLMRIPAQAPLHALRQIQTGVRCSIRPVRGAYRADLAPDRFNTAPSLRAGHRRSMSSAPHQ